MNRIFEVVENNGYLNPRNKYFLKELLVVLKEYLQANSIKFCDNDKEGLIELHIHTTLSDGEKTPNDIVEIAIQKGAQAISFTDHDTISAYDDLVYDKNKIQIIPGIELSAYSKVGRMHVLGYGIDIYNQAFRDKLDELHQNSIDNLLMFVEILAKDYSIYFKEEDIQNLVQLSRNIGRPDLAKLMVHEGIVQNVQDAFDRYLIDANIKIGGSLKKPTFQECFEIIKDAGGIPILAHPHSLLLDNYSLFEKIREMKKYGLQGIEAYHSNTSKELSEKLVSLAINENLYITGGSDYHGPIAKPNIQLFTGKNNNIKIKRLNLVDDLKNRRYN